MSWNDGGGGGWGGSGGGPWGRRPSGGGGREFEELVRNMQKKGRRFLPGGFGGIRGILIILVVLVAVWLASGVYRVDTNEQGVEVVFGRWVNTTTPGLDYNWPAPVGQVFTPTVTEIQQFTIGTTPNQSLMLTGDENIIDVKFVVKWKIDDAGKFLFNISDPEGTTRNVAESAMRQAIGRTPLATALAEGRAEVEQKTLELMQAMLDEYGAGVEIRQVELQSVDPPAAVIDAFRDVQAARADQERSINEAQAYQNQIVPVARGDAQRMIQEAEAYKEQVINTAQGDAARFMSVYNEYVLAEDVTERRIYLETMETVLRDMEKIVIDTGATDGQGVVPYLPLDQLRRSSEQEG